MAATKALDDLYKVTPAPAGRKIRELVYSTFMVEDHSLHFYFLAVRISWSGLRRRGRAQRAGLIPRSAWMLQEGHRMRRRLRELTSLAAGKAGHPVFGLPAESPSASPRPTRSASRPSPPRPSSSPSSRCKSSTTSPQELRLRQAHPGRFFHAPHLLHGPCRRPEPGQLLRRHAGVAPEGQETVKFAPNSTWTTSPSASSRGAT